MASSGPTRTGAETFSPEIELADRYARWVLSAFEGHIGANILDVGFGHLGLRRHLPADAAYIGLDVDPHVVEQARERSPLDRFVHGDLADPDLLFLLGSPPVDTVLCFNVLEHVTDDAEAIRTLLLALRPGGKLLLFVPALPCLYNDLDRLAGHVRRYTRPRLKSLVPAGEAEVLKLEYFNPIGALGWWANGLIRHESLGSKAVSSQVRFFDRVLLPVSAALTPLTRAIFGQSIVCVLTKT